MPTSNILTLEDFVIESIDFTNSDSYYSLKTECLELQLESVNYSMESSDILDMTIFESATEGSRMSNLKTNIVKKIGSIWSTIIKALKTFIKNIINVFTNGQNKKIKNLEAQAKDAGKKIDDLLERDTENRRKIQNLKDDLSKVLSNISEKDGVIAYLKSTNFDKDVQLRHLNTQINNTKVSNEVEGLHKKVLNLMDANKNNKEDAAKVLKMMKLVLSEDIEVNDVSTFCLNIDKYIAKFTNIFSLNGQKVNDVVSLYTNTYTSNGSKSAQKINSLIKTITTLKDDIEKSIGDEVSGSFTIESLENTDRAIREHFPNDNFFTYSPDSKESVNKITDNNPDLFAKYISAVMELSAVFKKGVGQYIDYTKSIIDARQWALQMEASIINIIRRIDMASK